MKASIVAQEGHLQANKPRHTDKPSTPASKVVRKSNNLAEAITLVSQKLKPGKVRKVMQ